jgi:hypothetical protein
VKSLEQESPELKYEIIHGHDLTEEEVDGIAKILAKMIYQQLIAEEKLNTEGSRKNTKQ